MQSRAHLTPPISALSLIVFDQKVGYTIAWKRSLPDVELDGVEYKSLPSGLHGIKEDLVYFIHYDHAGISAFVQSEADARHRNANFVAVSALVSQSYGQLGRSWVHAEGLRRLARDVVKNTDDKRVLELFWKKHRADDHHTRSNISSSSGDAAQNKKRQRALSDATLTGSGAEQTWPADHPAMHVPRMLHIFGPLLFPLYRAAVSRKRVLLLGSPPVQANADMIYVASVLSNIPQSLSVSLPSEAEPLFRTLPLFSVGIQDIATLEARTYDESGWLACTTDDILGEKKHLYDLLVRLPSDSISSKAWPQLQTSDGKLVKATQRDLSRWALLCRELRRLRRQIVGSIAEMAPELDVPSDEGSLLQKSHTSDGVFEDTSLVDRDQSEAIEPSTWIALAYRGFIWWASAGEAAAWENDETKADEELLFDMPDVHALFPDQTISVKSLEEREAEYARSAAVLLVAYFRRVTEGILKLISAIVEEADDQTEEGIEEDGIEVTSEDVRAMGLDGFSEADKEFVSSMMRVWFDREAVVLDQGVRMCGVRVC